MSMEIERQIQEVEKDIEHAVERLNHYMKTLIRLRKKQQKHLEKRVEKK